MTPESRLETLLKRGEFVVTSEIGPPKSADGASVREKASHLKGYADAFNVTDNQAATVRMSSLAGSLFCLQEGVEPVMQMTCRDRNRIAMQSDILGAHALGVRNVLCISGDHQRFGNHPDAKNVYDVDSTQQLMMFKRLRDEGTVWTGDALTVAPRLFLGAAANPFADPMELQVLRLAKKVDAGAQFVQTQAIFDLGRFEDWLQMVRAEGIDRRVHIIAGVLPLRSVKAARFMAGHVPGMLVPESVLERMEKAADPKEEGIRIWLETLEEVRRMSGVHGVHLMPVAWESVLPRLVCDAGLYPRPEL